jgi:aminopeptidase
MYNDFAPKLAKVLTEYAQPVKPGDYVVIEGSVHAAPLITALYEAALRRGGNPATRVTLPGLREIFYREANDNQLSFLEPMQMTYIEKADVWYYIFASSNTRELNGTDPAKTAKYQATMRPFYDLYFGRHAEGTLRWNGCGWPTQADAQEAEMGLLAYTEFMYKACALDQPDPLAYWRAFSDRQAKLVDWLDGKHRCEVRGPGIDLAFDFSERPWINCDGHVNFPDGEIFTSPIEDSVNGHVAFSYPSVYAGHYVRGVELTFKDGVVVEASADQGEDFLMSQLDIDAGARRLGEFAVGTNNQIQQFVGSTLFDEKIGGTIHMAIGHSIPESKGVNDSAIHWDMVHNMKDGGEIRIDGELFYQGGRFVIEA